MKAAAWIDRVKVAKGWESDYRTAKELRITRASLTEMRSGRTKALGEGTALRVAALLNTDPAIVLADQAMERAQDANARSAWEAVLKRLGGVAASILFAVGAGGTPNADAASRAISAPSTGATFYTSYHYCPVK